MKTETKLNLIFITAVVITLNILLINIAVEVYYYFKDQYGDIILAYLLSSMLVALAVGSTISICLYIMYDCNKHCG